MTEKGECPVSRRLRVLMAIPVRAAASRWEMLAARSAADTLAAMPREVSAGVIKETIVPKRGRGNPQRGFCSTQYGHLQYQMRGSLLCMDMNPASRDRQVAELNRAVSEQLRAERAASNMTIDALANAAGVNRKTVMRLESGERSADVMQLAAMCAVFGLPLGDFMARAQQRVDRSRVAVRDVAAEGGIGG